MTTVGYIALVIAVLTCIVIAVLASWEWDD